MADTGYRLQKIVNRNTDDPKVKYKWRKNLTYLTTFLGLLIVGRIWFEGLQPVATFLGLLSAGLAIALRDPVTDIAGWVFLLWRKPLDVGDRIQIGEVKGDVIDIRIFMFTVLEIGNWVHAYQSTGRVVHVPNITKCLQSRWPIVPAILNSSGMKFLSC